MSRDVMIGSIKQYVRASIELMLNDPHLDLHACMHDLQHIDSERINESGV